VPAALLLSAFACRSIAAEFAPAADDPNLESSGRHATHPPAPAGAGGLHRLKAYVIYDYLVAARLRRDLSASHSDALDATIDDFLHSHNGQPVTHGLKHDWLQSLAERKRWDWFLSRSADTTDPQLICDRLAGRLATNGDAAGLAQEALARWIGRAEAA